MNSRDQKLKPAGPVVNGYIKEFTMRSRNKSRRYPLSDLAHPVLLFSYSCGALQTRALMVCSFWNTAGHPQDAMGGGDLGQEVWIQVSFRASCYCRESEISADRCNENKPVQFSASHICLVKRYVIDKIKELWGKLSRIGPLLYSSITAYMSAFEKWPFCTPTNVTRATQYANPFLSYCAKRRLIRQAVGSYFKCVIFAGR